MFELSAGARYNFGMAEITEETVKHLAELARIELKPEEVETLTKNLATILDYVEALKAVNTDGLPEVSQVTGLKNILREDVPVNQLISESVSQDLIKDAPFRENGYVKVRAIFE